MKKMSERIIITDDSLRARMLVAHHLEYSVALHEQGDFLTYSGSYNGVPLVVASTGFDRCDILDCIRKLKDLGATEIVYMSTCVSTSRRYDIRSLVLAHTGRSRLFDRTVEIAERHGIATHVATVLHPDDSHPEEGCISCDITGAFYNLARENNLDALALLTVSENTFSGTKMDTFETRSRLYPASNLVFEIMSQA